MPILWRYILKGYFRSFFLCVFGFVAVLLVIRFQEIALFAASGAGLRYVALFSLYQIPYILPLAIPISCLIGSMMLFRGMSTSLELTALRASGASFPLVAYPLLLSGLVIGLINFAVVSELAPVSRTGAKELIYKIGSENPLVIFQKDSLLGLKTMEFDLKTLRLGKKAGEVLCVFKQASSDRIALFTAEELLVEKDSVIGKSICILSGAAAEDPEGYDHLIIENQETIQSDKSIASERLFRTEWFSKEDLLPFAELLNKLGNDSKGLKSKYWIELTRRVSLGLYPLSFTLIGIAFGTVIGRNRKKGALFSAFGCASLILICFVACKSLGKDPFTAWGLYIVPQIAVCLYSLRCLSLSCQGVE